MVMIMTVIIAGIGLAALLQAVNRAVRSSMYTYGDPILINIIVTVLYLMVVGLVWLFEVYSGYDPVVIYVALAIAVIVMTALFVKIYIDHPKSTNKTMLIIFCVYFALVVYLTIFMRIGSVSTSVKTEAFDDLKEVFIRRDPSMATHFFLNILMFMPFGYLIPATNPKHLGGWSFSMMGGLVASTVIEGCQMVFRLGESDIDDIIANTLGAILGYAILRFVWQFRKNWRLT